MRRTHESYGRAPAPICGSCPADQRRIPGHVFGKNTRKEFCYDNLHISRNAWDTNLVKVAAARHCRRLSPASRVLTCQFFSRQIPSTYQSIGSRAAAAHSQSFPSASGESFRTKYPSFAATQPPSLTPTGTPSTITSSPRPQTMARSSSGRCLMISHSIQMPKRSPTSPPPAG